MMCSPFFHRAEAQALSQAHVSFLPRQQMQTHPWKEPAIGMAFPAPSSQSIHQPNCSAACKGLYFYYRQKTLYKAQNKSVFKNSLWCLWSLLWPRRAIKILSDNWLPERIRARQDHARLRLYQYFSWLKTDTEISLEVICEANLCLRLWRLFSYSQESRENQRLFPWEKVENHHWKFISASSWGSWKEVGHGHWF